MAAMGNATLKTSSGSEVVVDTSDLEVSLADHLITPNDAPYEDARQVWNGMIDRKPGLIARCRGVADVVRSVRFAREHEILVAVRGGGHNVAGFGTCDGGLVIDLSAMNAVRVDPAKRTARAEGGTLLGDLDRETQVFGLAAPGGVVSTTGIAGLTLGGGQGWLRRTYGMTCDSLLSADVVTADGGFLTVNADQTADLFWALRGGGGNFGVVTSFEYRLYPVGPTIAFAGPVYPMEAASEVLRGLREFMRDAPNEINATTVHWRLPTAPPFPETVQGKDVIIVGAIHAGSVDAGERLLQPLRELGEPILDLSARMPWTALQQMFDPFYPKGELHYYWKSIYLESLSDDVIEAIDIYAQKRPSPMSNAVIWALGGALDRIDERDTAAGKRDAPYSVEIMSNWSDPKETDANIAWAREFYDAMKPFSSGKPNVNFPGLGEDSADFVRAAYGANYERLVATKRKYDPTNLFRLNQNINPEG